MQGRSCRSFDYDSFNDQRRRVSSKQKPLYVVICGNQFESKTFMHRRREVARPLNLCLSGSGCGYSWSSRKAKINNRISNPCFSCCNQPRRQSWDWNGGVHFFRKFPYGKRCCCNLESKFPGGKKIIKIINLFLLI